VPASSPRFVAVRVGSFVCWVVVVWSSLALAQSRDDVWVVPVTDDAAGATSVVEGARRTLRDAGYVVPDAQATSERFEAAISRAAVSLQPQEVDDWRRHATAAVRHLARADYEAARADLDYTRQVAQRAAAELNREPERAREVLDTCLYLVRALREDIQ